MAICWQIRDHVWCELPVEAACDRHHQLAAFAMLRLLAEATAAVTCDLIGIEHPLYRCLLRLVQQPTGLQIQ